MGENTLGLSSISEIEIFRVVNIFLTAITCTVHTGIYETLCDINTD